MKKLILTLSAFIVLTIASFAQSDTITVKKPTSDNGPQQVFRVVQQMPSFIGDVNKYIADNIHYPDQERKKGIQGTVFVNFIVEKDGSISNVKVLKGVENGPGLDAEALRVISSMPRWKPGIQNGKPVSVYFNIPIRFVLQ